MTQSRGERDDQPVEPERPSEPDQPAETDHSVEADRPAEADHSAEADRSIETDQPAGSDQPAEKVTGSGRTPGWLRPAVIGLAAAVVVAGAGGWALGNWQGRTSAHQEQAAQLVGPGKSLQNVSDLPRRVEDDPFALGAVDAPVVISVFSDFECPFCAKFNGEAEPKIVEEYVNTGKVRLEWNDMPINGPAARLAAQAGRAAGAQGKFFEFQNALYADARNGQGHPENSLDDLVGFAEQAGVGDLDRFRSEIEDGTYGAAVDRATAVGIALGIQGTPLFLVGDQPVNGAQPFEAFKKIIDAQLNGTPPDAGEKAGQPGQQGDEAGHPGQQGDEADRQGDEAGHPGRPDDGQADADQAGVDKPEAQAPETGETSAN